MSTTGLSGIVVVSSTHSCSQYPGLRYPFGLVCVDLFTEVTLISVVQKKVYNMIPSPLDFRVQLKTTNGNRRTRLLNQRDPESQEQTFYLVILCDTLRNLGIVRYLNRSGLNFNFKYCSSRNTCLKHQWRYPQSIEQQDQCLWSLKWVSLLCLSFFLLYTYI